MTEPIQILIFAVVITLTIIMVIIGWQIYLILSEIRKSFMKMNNMFDKAMAFTDNIGKDINGFAEGIKAILGIIKVITHKKEKK